MPPGLLYFLTSYLPGGVSSPCPPATSPRVLQWDSGFCLQRSNTLLLSKSALDHPLFAQQPMRWLNTGIWSLPLCKPAASDFSPTAFRQVFPSLLLLPSLHPPFTAALQGCPLSVALCLLLSPGSSTHPVHCAEPRTGRGAGWRRS